MNSPRFVWVVNYRLELEGNAQQTEAVYPAVFTGEEEAQAYALCALRFFAKKWGVRVGTREEFEMVTAFCKRGGVGFVKPYLFQLSDSDNLVIELAKCRLWHGEESKGRGNGKEAE